MQAGIAIGGFGAAAVAAGAVGAAALAGLGAGVLGLGIAFAAMDERVKTAFGGLKEHVGDAMKELSKPLVEPLIRSAGALKAAFDTIAPSLGRIFKAGAPLIDLFNNQLGGIATRLGPMLESAFAAALPVMREFIIGLNPVIAGLGGFFLQLRNPAFATFTGALMRAIGGLLPQLGRLLSALAPLGTQILNMLVPAFTGLVNIIVSRVLPVMQSIFNFIDQHRDGFGQLVIGIGLFVAAVQAMAFIGSIIAAISSAVGVLVTVFRGLQTVILVVRSAMMLLSIAFALNPIGIVIAAIVALIAIFVLLYKNSETVRDAIDAAWKAIKTATVAVWEFIGDFLKNLWTEIKQEVTTAVNAVKSVVTAVWTAIKSATSATWDAIKTAVSTVIEWIKTAVTAYFNAYKAVITGVWNAISAATSAVWNAVKTVVSTVWEWMKTAVTTYFNAYKTVITTVWNVISTATSTVWNAIKSLVTGAASAISGAVTNAMNTVRSIITSVWNAAKTATTAAWTAIKTAVTTGITNMMTALGTIVSKVKGVFSGAGKWLLEAGKDIIRGLLNGIKSMAGAAANAAKDVANSVKNAVTGALGINSPSKVFRAIGVNINEGLVLGLERTAGIKRAASGLSKAVAQGFEAPALALSHTPIAAGAGAGNTYNITVEVPLGASPEDVGRELVNAIKSYESVGGTRWRSAA